MEYQVNMGVWGSVFAVPTAVVDEHIRLCGSASLKVLLLVLRAPGQRVAVEELSARLGLSPGDVADALGYWVEAGLLSPAAAAPAGQADAPRTAGGEAAGQPAAGDAPAPPAPPAVPTGQPGQKTAAAPPQMADPGNTPRYNRREVTAMVQKSQLLRGLVQEAQQLLGRPLNTVDLDTLVALHSYYGLSAHYILTLVSYCVSIGKASMRYIEKTAATFLEEGIGDEQLDEHISLLLSRNQLQQQVRRAMGIRDRELTAREKQYILNWTEQLHYPPEMIALASERTIDNTGRLSLPYLNSILESWARQGIRTTAQALQEPKPAKPAAGESSPRQGELDWLAQAEFIQSK